MNFLSAISCNTERKRVKSKEQDPNSIVFVDCGLCVCWYDAPCQQHPYRYIPDQDVACGEESYARESAPACVQVGLSDIHGAGYGIWAGRNIEPNTLFGPYIGKIYKKAPHGSEYIWEVNVGGKQDIVFIDGEDKRVSNWIRYVNHSDDANLEPFQWDQKIWYVSKKNILRGQELNVSYGKQYAEVLADKAQPRRLKANKLKRAETTLTEVYQCPDCDDCFSCATFLLKHRKFNHRPITPHQCLLCNKYFLESRDLKKHHAWAHNKKSRNKSCDMCGYRHYSVDRIWYHILNIHVKPRFYCDICKKGIKTYVQLELHIRTHSKIKPYVCNICGAQFPQMSGLRSHRRYHGKQKPFQCSLCDKRYPSKAVLALHIRTVHKGEKLYACDLCGKSCSQPQALREHMRSHTLKKPFSCSQCGKKFRYKSNAWNCRERHTGVKLFECKECNKKFPNSTVLRHHIERHHIVQKNYHCKECGKSFLSKKDLKQHRRQHTGEKPFTCDICGEPYVHFQRMNEHIQKLHSGLRPYSCEFCPKTFVNHSNWRNHERTHTRKNLYKCTVCGKEFVQCGGLKRHARIHTGEKPYKCKSCPMKFADGSALIRHSRLH